LEAVEGVCGESPIFSDHGPREARSRARLAFPSGQAAQAARGRAQTARRRAPSLHPRVLSRLGFRPAAGVSGARGPCPRV
jgi:hypothetical protein